MFKTNNDKWPVITWTSDRISMNGSKVHKKSKGDKWDLVKWITQINYQKIFLLFTAYLSER